MIYAVLLLICSRSIPVKIERLYCMGDVFAETDCVFHQSIGGSPEGAKDHDCLF